MADIVHLFAASHHNEPAYANAARRLRRVTGALAELGTSNLRTPEDLRRALHVVNLAIACFRSALADLGDHPSADDLLHQAEKLVAGFNTARIEMLSYPAK